MAVVAALIVPLLASPAIADDDGPPATATDTGPPGAYDVVQDAADRPPLRLLEEVQAGEQVEVIVTFAADLPARDAVGPAADRGRERGVSRARADLAGRLSDRGISIDRSYPRSAHVTVTVTAEQIDDLEVIPGVTGVTLNHRVALMLDAATDVVGANPASVGGTTLTGAGRAVAILDTGVQASHPFFAREGGGHRVVAEACFAENGDCPKGMEGPGSGAPLLVDGQPHSHGTHVAGIAAGSRDATTPAHGMAPKADILSVQVFSSAGPYARWADIAAGLEWVYTQRLAHNISAVNLSLGGGSYSDVCDRVDPNRVVLGPIDDLRAAGIVTVAASGNDYGRDGVAAPACFSNVVAVGASTNSDTIANFSNIGDEVDLVAPGASIRSSVVGGGYALFSGTSMASPMVAGALALSAEASPTASAGRLVDAVTTSYTTIDDQRSSGVVIGLPHLDLPASLAALGRGTTSTQLAPSVSSTLGSLRTNVSWSQPKAANGGTLTYRLHRSEGSSSCSSKSAVLYQGRGIGYVDKGLIHGRTYSYCAYATEGTGNVSARSNVRTVTANDTVAPSAPSLSGSGGDRQAKLSWTRVSDPTTPITYRLYRSTGSSCSTSSTRVATTTNTSFTDTGLDPDRTYRYCVTATDGAGNRSALSNIRSITTTDPIAGCTALAGDWNRSGKDGIGWWCDGKTKLRTSSGQVISYNYGLAGDVPVVADWNGNGQDTVSVIRDGTWHVNNHLSGGASERTFNYGRVAQGDVPIAGDWNRGSVDLPGIIRDREWHLRAEQSGGDSDWSFIYGRLTRGDLPLWGDWNRDRRDTAGIVRDGTWHLRNIHAGGASDISFIYGRVLAGDLPVVGDWTGDRIDTPGIVRDGQWHLRYENKGGAADQVITFRNP